MCFSGGQPKAPINKPTYAPDQASDYFDVTMEDEEDGKVKSISKRTAQQNKDATAGRT